jgi:hypothetical protein
LLDPSDLAHSDPGRTSLTGRDRFGEI